MRKFLLAILAAALLCGGCSRKEGSWRVLSEISVTCHRQGGVTRHGYTDPDKLRRLLMGLRTLGQVYKPDVAVEQLLCESYCMVLVYTDGSQQTCRVKADRYIRQGDEQWRQTDPASLSHLLGLLRTLPPDTTQTLQTDRFLPPAAQLQAGFRLDGNERTVNDWGPLKTQFRAGGEYFVAS